MRPRSDRHRTVRPHVVPARRSRRRPNRVLLASRLPEGEAHHLHHDLRRHQRSTLLQSGGVDLVAQVDGREITRIKGFKSTSTMSRPAPRLFVRRRYYLLNVARAPFNDREARQAVALASTEARSTT